MSKQTAVQWLHYHLAHLMQTREWRSKDLHIEKFDELFVEALSMEREQIEEAFRQGELFSSDYYDGKNINSQYYEITYKGGEQ